MTSSSQSPRADLMDDFAMAAMAEFIHIYAPETMDNKEEKMHWCASIASTSYVLATAMMDTRAVVHKMMIENFQGEKPNAD